MDREPSDASTEEFVPDFLDSTSEQELDVGISLFDRRTGEDDPVSAAPVEPSVGTGLGGRRRIAVIASLVLLVVIAAVLTGYAAVRAAGGWQAMWVSSNDPGKTGTDPSPASSAADAGQVSGSPSASSSASGGASPSGTGTAAPSAPPGGGTTSTYSPPGPAPTWSTHTPSPSPSSTPPPEPTPTRTKPHD